MSLGTNELHSSAMIGYNGPFHRAIVKSITSNSSGVNFMSLRFQGHTSNAASVLSAIVLAASLAWISSSAAEAPQGKNGPPAKPARTPWTTSRVVGSPDPPPPYKVVRAFPKVKFHHPLLIARPPGSDRLFVGEQDGVLYSFADSPDAKAELFFDLRKELKTIHLLADAKEVEALYGMTFHPKFQTNRQCFVCYTLRSKKGQRNLPDGTRVSRFTVTKTEPPRIDPASEEVVISFLQG